MKQVCCLNIFALCCILALAGSCSESSEAELGDLSILTFNAALLPWGGQKYTEERVPEIAEALKAVDADVICFQEVWEDGYFNAIQQELKQIYPNYFVSRTIDESPEYNPVIHCDDRDALEDTVECMDELCVPDGISTYNCLQEECKDYFDALTDECVFCVMTNPDWGSLACVLGGATDYVYHGRNGLGFLSKKPLKDTTYYAYETVMVKRGVLSTTVDGRRIHCTHLSTSEYVGIPYLGSNDYESFFEEQRGEMEELVEVVSEERCHLVAGDFNSGNAYEGIDETFPSIIERLEEAGFSAPWEAPQCTWCQDNTLVPDDDVGNNNSWIDNVYVRGCGEESYTYTRALDEEAYIRTFDDGWVHSSLSDHYGLKLQITRE